MQKIIEILESRGITATLEHPGYVSVITADGEWCFGTANGDWQGDLLAHDGERCGGLDLGLDTSCAELAVAEAIGRAISKRYLVTAANLLDILERAKSVIEEAEGADEHGELIGELGGLVELLTTEIGASHLGTGSDMAIITRGE
jgi:hypothetical protein